MAIFISYSHEDKDFVDKLAVELVKNRARIWMDRWELSVGDSIVDRVQTAIKDASALLVVLSEAAVKSQWCKKELSAGLIRELDEKRVVVLPVLLESCEVPTFLKDKLYADFRVDFGEGLRTTLEAIAKVNSDTLGTLGTPSHFVDWSIDADFTATGYVWQLTNVERMEENSYSVLTTIVAFANEEATARQKHYAGLGYPDFGRLLVLMGIAEQCESAKLQLRLTDNRGQSVERTLHDPKTGVTYEVAIASRRMGEDSGKDVLVDITGQLQGVVASIKASTRPIAPDDLARLLSA